MNLICMMCGRAITTSKSSGKLCFTCNLSSLPDDQDEGQKEDTTLTIVPLYPAKKALMDG